LKSLNVFLLCGLVSAGLILSGCQSNGKSAGHMTLAKSVKAMPSGYLRVTIAGYERRAANSNSNPKDPDRLDISKIQYLSTVNHSSYQCLIVYTFGDKQRAVHTSSQNCQEVLAELGKIDSDKASVLAAYLPQLNTNMKELWGD